MTDYPTVGLGVDFNELDRAQQKLDKLEGSLDQLPGRAKAAGDALNQSSRKQTAANQDTAKSYDQTAAKAEAAAKREQKAAERALKEEQRARYQLRQVQAAWARMQEAEATRVSNREIAEAKRAAREVERAQRAARIANAGGGSSGGGVTNNDITLVGRFTQALSTLRKGLGETRSLLFDLRTAVAVFLGGLVIKPILDAADAMTSLESRTRLYAARASDVPYIFEQVYRTAQDARASLDGVATLYTRLAPLSQQLGKSQTDLLKTVSTVSKAFAIGGSSAAEATASAQQFAQALSSNRFGGDELRSVAENAPVLLQAIAEGVNKINPSLNLNAATFIKWAQAGNANAAIVVKALDASAAKIDAMFKQFPTTISQSITLVTNAFQHLVGEVNKTTGASQAIANLIAKFAAFLESKKTIDAVTSALETLGKIANGTFLVIKTIGDYLPTIIALMAALAGAAGIQAVNKALAAMAIAWALSGREMTAWNVVAGLTTTATRALTATLFTMEALLTGGLIIAIVAVTTSLQAISKAQETAQKSTETWASTQETAMSALSRAATFTAAYGGNTDNLARSLANVAGATSQAAGATKSGSDQNSTALRIAQARAEAEKTLTVAILRRAAADAGKDAHDLDKSINGFFGIRNQRDAYLGSGANNPDIIKKNNERLAQSEKNLQNLRDTQAQLNKAADELQNLKVVATVPDPILPKGLGTTDKDLKGLDGAINRIAKMQAEVKGLQAIFDSLTSSNPLSYLADQIKAAGDEAAAQYTSGKAAKAGFADKARAAAQDKERLKILIDLKRGHLDAAHAAEVQAASDAIASKAAVSSQDTLREFWGGSTRELGDYMQALTAAREAETEAAIAQNDLAIAQQYGATSIDGISAALERNKVAYGDQAKAIQAAAQAQSDADADRLRRAAKNSATQSKPQDIADFNSRVGQEAIDNFAKIQSAGEMLASSLGDAFGSVGQSIGDLVTIMNDYSARQLKVMKEVQEARDKFGADSDQARDAEIRGQGELTQARLKSYGDMASAAKGFFEKGSSGYKVLTAAEKAFRLFEFAMSVKSVVVKAAETAAKVGLFGAQAAAAAEAGAANMFASLGPLGFAAVAAMVAVLAGFGFRGGHGGGASAIPVSEMRQNAQGSGSVLGDSTAKSQSIAHALDIANDLASQDLSYSDEMVKSLRLIQGSIGAVSALLARQLGVGGAFSTSDLGLGTTTTGASTLLKLLNPVAAILPGLFGKSVTTTLQDQGLQFNNGTLGQILSGGLSGQTYQDIATQTKKKAFGVTYSNKTSTSSNYQDLDADISTQLNLLVKNLQSGVVAAATTLGIKGAEETLKSFEVSLGKISFKDMTGDQIEEALNAVFGKLGDDMATYLLPTISEFQKVGEGAFETIVRLAAEYKAVDQDLALIGMEFKTMGLESVKARDYLVQLAGGLDNFNDQASFFAQNFLTDAEQLKPYQDALATGLEGLGQSATLTREEFKKLVQGLDVSTQAGADLYQSLMDIAPLFDKVADAQEKQAAAVLEKRTDIQDKIDALTLSDADLLKKTREAEMAATVALDPALGALLQNLYDLQDAATEAAKAAQIASDRSNAWIALLKAQGRTEEATAAERQAALAKIEDPLTRFWTEQAYMAQDAADRVDAARSALTDAYNAEKSALEDTRDKFADFVTTLADFRKELDLGDSSTLSFSEKLSEASAEFDRVVSLMNNNKEEGFSSLPGASQDYLDAAKNAAHSKLEYDRALGAVRNAVATGQAKAQEQVSIADQQLAALDASVAGLIEVNKSTLSVVDAIKELQAALLAQQELINGTVGGVGSAGAAAGVIWPYGTSYEAMTDQQRANAANGNATWAYGLANTMLAQATANDPGTKAIIAAATGYKFANGGIFDDGIVRRATTFGMGTMGEDGPEGVLPLVQTSNGLGVSVSGQNDNSHLEKLIEGMIDDNRRFQVGSLQLMQTQDTRERRRDAIGLGVRNATSPDPTTPLNVKAV